MLVLLEHLTGLVAFYVKHRGYYTYNIRERTMKRHYLLVFLAVLSIAGCSQRDLYDSFQEYQKNECMKLPETQFDDCVGNADKSYHTYKDERDEVLGNIAP
jgi:hypothetical protein